MDRTTIAFDWALIFESHHAGSRHMSEIVAIAEKIRLQGNHITVFGLSSIWGILLHTQLQMFAYICAPSLE